MIKFLLTADWHLRGERPRCRMDADWVDSQRQDIRWVVSTANDFRVPLVLVGDIFHLPRVATEVVNMLISELALAENPVYILAGNHDLPYHSYDHVEKCSFGTLRQMPNIVEMGPEFVQGNICGAPFGLDKPAPTLARFVHRLVFPDDKSRPMGVECGQIAEELLAEFPEQTWIFTGDYHHAFHFEQNGRHVVNPGCLNIQAADMIGYSPRVALVDLKRESVEWLNIPAAATITTDQYLVKAAEKEERIEAFLDAVSTGGAVSLSFADNLAAKIQQAKSDPKISPEILQNAERAISEIMAEVKSEK